MQGEIINQEYTKMELALEIYRKMLEALAPKVQDYINRNPNDKEIKEIFDKSLHINMAEYAIYLSTYSYFIESYFESMIITKYKHIIEEYEDSEELLTYCRGLIKTLADVFNDR